LQGIIFGESNYETVISCLLCVQYIEQIFMPYLR